MDDLVETAKEIISKVMYITIATTSKDGQPWNTPVFSAYDENYTFYWNSNPRSQHSKNIAENSKVFLAIYDSSAAQGTGEGVYVKGQAFECTDGKEIEEALLLLKKRAESFQYNSSADFLGDNPRRVYKAVPESFWRNIDKKTDIYHNDSRVEVKLNN